MAVAPAPAQPPSWDGRGAFLVVKTMETDFSKACSDRTCDSRSGGIGEGERDLGAISASVKYSPDPADQNLRLDYLFVGCTAEMKGCGTLKIGVYYFQSDATADRMERWNATESPCIASNEPAGFYLTRAVPLTA